MPDSRVDVVTRFQGVFKEAWTAVRSHRCPTGKENVREESDLRWARLRYADETIENVESEKESDVRAVCLSRSRAQTSDELGHRN